MRDRLQALADAARREISVASEPSAVEALRIRYLGKKGELSGVLGGMGKLPPDERRALGRGGQERRGVVGRLAGIEGRLAPVSALPAVTVDRDASASLSRNNPWHGHVLRSRVVHTVYGGRVTVRDGALVE